ncbi:MAG TPA: FMN reductase [Marmoricola sp.]|nr:FMN reductase [Marmoricola sp.]
MTHRIAVVTAGLSEPSSTRLLADLLADATAARLGPDTVVDVVELRPLARDLANATVTGFPAGDLAAAVEKVVTADGLVAVTPVFSASYSGLFKMFFDVLDTGALEGMPVLVAATAGTPRHSLVLDHAMRPLFGYLKAVVVPTGVFAASEDWGGGGSVVGELRDRVDRAADQLAALVKGQPPGRRTGPAEDGIDFETLLNP